MENATTGLKAPDKSPDEIEREMFTTRESITEKVAALETQVKGNIEAVTGTVAAVKDAITSAPAAVTETVKQTFEAVKDSVRDTVQSMDLSACVARNPWTAVGSTTVAGFLTGFFLLGGRSRAEPGATRTAFVPQSAAAEARPGYLDRVFGDTLSTIGKELSEIAERAFSSAVSALKQNVGTVVPQMVDQAVHRVAEPVSDAINARPTTQRMGNGSGV